MFEQCITLWSGVLYTKFGSHMQFDLWLTLADPFMTFKPSNVLHFGQPLSTKFAGHGAFLSNLTSSSPQLNPMWPLTQQWATLWSEVLPNKFGTHRTFLRQLDLWMTFDLWWGHFKIWFFNLGGLPPTWNHVVSWSQVLNPYQVSTPYVEARRNAKPDKQT